MKRPQNNKPDAIPNDKVIEWPLDASPEWIDAIFGERANAFVRQVAELHIERKIRAMAESDEPQP